MNALKWLILFWDKNAEAIFGTGTYAIVILGILGILFGFVLLCINYPVTVLMIVILVALFVGLCSLLAFWEDITDWAKT